MTRYTARVLCRHAGTLDPFRWRVFVCDRDSVRNAQAAGRAAARADRYEIHPTELVMIRPANRPPSIQYKQWRKTK